MCDAEKDWHERSFRASGAINGCQKYPLPEPEIKFSFLYFWVTSSVLFNGLFDIFDPNLNTILSVGISFKYFEIDY